MTDHFRLFVNGQSINAADGQTFETIDPSTGRPHAAVAPGRESTWSRRWPPPRPPSRTAAGRA